MKVETYLINLDGSDERLASATTQLNAQQFSFTRFPAYDGRKKQLSDFVDYNDQKANQIMGRSLLNSELGCYMSHLGCVKKFLQTDADYLIVLEDDLKVSEHFKETVDDILKYLDTHRDLDWYLINLAAKKRKIYTPIQTFEHHTLIHAYYFPIRGIGLIWSRQGAQAFVNYIQDISMPVDNVFQTWLSQNGKGLSVWPPLLKPNGLDSDIDGAAATQSQRRNDKAHRSWSYNVKKQKRMWCDRLSALKNKYNIS